MKPDNVFLVPKWCLPFGYGIALWKWAFVAKDTEHTPYVIAHELCHLKQIERLGFWRFYYEYFKENMRVGNEKNKFEVEAIVW